MDFFDYHGGVYWLLVLGAVGGAGVVEWAARHWRRAAEEGADLPASCGLTGGAIAKQLLAAAGIPNVAVVRSDKTDRYDARHREVHLRHDTFAGASLLSLAVAAHEVGHAQQFAQGAWPARWRRLFWPVCYVLTPAAIGLLILSLGVLPGTHAGLAIAAVGLVSLLLQLPVVLPLEYDAWRRAKALARDAGLLAPAEEPGFGRLLTAAAGTYVAAEVRRWIMLLLVVAVTVWILPQLSVDVVPPPGTLAGPEQVEPWFDDDGADGLDDGLFMWLPSLADLVAP